MVSNFGNIFVYYSIMNPLKLLLVLAMFALSASSLSAQAEKTLTEDEYVDVVDSAFDATAKRIRRVTKTVVSFTEGHEIGSETATEEFIPPDSWHKLRQLRAGSESTSFEIIEVGDAKYKRSNQDMWAKWYRMPYNEVKVTYVGFEDVMTVTYQAFETDYGEAVKYTSRPSVLNGHQAVLYSKVSNGLKNGNARIGIEEIWVSSAGLVLRVMATRSEVEPIWTKRTEISYEYDPKDLKIEAPIK